jgi:hypothetical protein
MANTRIAPKGDQFESMTMIKFDVKVHIMDAHDNSKIREIVPCRKAVITKSMLYF